MPVAILVSTLITVLGVVPCQAADHDSPITGSIVIGTLAAEPFPFYIAEDLQYFMQNGLNVRMLHFDTEASILDALKNGELDFAWSSEYSIVNQAFASQNISVIASIGKSYSAYLIGRKDLGIENVADLKGKRIGLAQQTIIEFYLGRFLELNGMNIEDITPVNIGPSQAVEAITGGDVEAVVVMPPDLAQIQSNLGNKTVIWSVQSNQANFNLLSARNEWITQHPAIVEQLLKAMDQADNYLTQYPDQAKAIIQKSGEYDAAFLTEVWPEDQFFLSLDQSLIVAMEDEANWMINNNLTNEEQIPNFLDYIYSDGLMAVKPQAVNLIH